MKKFELDYSSSTTYQGRTLYRIKALKTFTTVSAVVSPKGIARLVSLHTLKKTTPQLLSSMDLSA